MTSIGNFHKNIGLINDLYGLGINDAQLRYYAQSFPFIGDLVRFYEGNQKTQDYMRNRGLSWDDVKYATNLSAGMVSNPLRSMSAIDRNMDAIESLYQHDGLDKGPKPIRYDHHGTAYTSRNFYNDY